MMRSLLLLPLLIGNLITITLLAQTRIPMTVGRNGHLLVNAKIAGVEGTFIFDTGAGYHVVSKKFFQKIRDHVRDSSYATAFRHTGERLDLPIYLFDGISVGPVTQNNPWLGVYEGFDEQGFDGLFSCKLIEDHPVTIDIANGLLIAESAESMITMRGASIPVSLHADRDRSLDFFIKVKLGDRYDALVEFDTGSGYSPILLHTRYMRYASLDTTQMEIRQSATGFGRTEKTYFDKSRKLRLFLPEINDGGYPNFIFKPSLIYDGLTSHAIFGNRVWTIDLPNKRILVHQ